MKRGACEWMRAAWPDECQTDSRELRDAEVQAVPYMERGPERRAHTESPHAAATPMMARARKWTARAVGTLSATVVFCSVLASSFCLVLVVLVFWDLARVSIFCSSLTWNVPSLLCRAKAPWSYRGGRRAGAHVLFACGQQVAEQDAEGLGSRPRRAKARVRVGVRGPQRGVCG